MQSCEGPANDTNSVRGEASLEKSPQEQGIISENDPAITTESLTVQGGAEPTDVYVVYPNGVDRAPGVVVIHGNRGIEPHFRDVARRLGKLGYVALAPDLLTCKGGGESFADGADARAAIESRDLDDMVEDLRACVDWLSKSDRVDSEHLGMIGFCYGGRLTWRTVTKEPRLRAAVPFYGSYPPVERVPNIETPVLAIYGGLDERVNAGIPIITEAMTAADKVFEKEIYPNAKHAFFHDQNPDSHNPIAAKAAWIRATEWLDRWLRPTDSKSA